MLPMLRPALAARRAAVCRRAGALWRVPPAVTLQRRQLSGTEVGEALTEPLAGR